MEKEQFIKENHSVVLLHFSSYCFTYKWNISVNIDAEPLFECRNVAEKSRREIFSIC